MRSFWQWCNTNRAESLFQAGAPEGGRADGSSTCHHAVCLNSFFQRRKAPNSLCLASETTYGCYTLLNSNHLCFIPPPRSHAWALIETILFQFSGANLKNSRPPFGGVRSGETLHVRFFRLQWKASGLTRLTEQLGTDPTSTTSSDRLLLKESLHQNKTSKLKQQILERTVAEGWWFGLWVEAAAHIRT